MGEVFHALQYLNRTMNLGLDAKSLLRAEMGFKSRLELVGNPVAERFANDPVGLAENFETVTVLRPRAEKLNIAQLQKFATAHVKADLKSHVSGRPDITQDMLDVRTKATKAPTKAVTKPVTAATKAGVGTKVSGATTKTTPTR